MNHLINITDMTDNVFEAFMASNGGETVVVEHLTVSERWQLARALGWDKTQSHITLAQWCGAWPEEKSEAGPDYEGKILAQAEARYSSQ